MERGRSSAYSTGPMSIDRRADRNDRSWEWALFLLVSLCSLQGAWVLNYPDPYEFLRGGGDNLCYYQWLPSVFADHEVDNMYWCYKLADGKALSICTIGVALLQLPFYGIGHLFATCLGYPEDGFSAPYAVANMACTAVYVGLGCVLAFRLARRFSNSESALISVVALFASTNLFYYSVYEPGYSHVFSFFLISVFCYTGLRVQDGARRVHVVGLVLSGALLVLVRHLNVIVFLFPLLHAWRSSGGLRGFFGQLYRHRGVFVLATIAASVPWALQMAYWHHITGNAFTFTYGAKGEGFEWDKMVPGMVLFSVRNGWLIYTPMLLPVLINLMVNAWRGTQPARSILLILTISCLLYSAWWCWWLGSSYGGRGFVDLYALLAIPLAWLLRSVLERPWSARLAAALFFYACITLNFGLMERFQWHWSWEGWTWQKFFQEISCIVAGKC